MDAYETRKNLERDYADRLIDGIKGCDGENVKRIIVAALAHALAQQQRTVFDELTAIGADEVIKWDSGYGWMNPLGREQSADVWKAAVRRALEAIAISEAD